MSRAYGRKQLSSDEELQEARVQRSRLDERVAHLERLLEDRMVAQGLAPDPRPPFLSEEAAGMYRDFFRLAERSVSIGMAGAAVNISLPWLAVSDWAMQKGEDPEHAREIFFSLRDERSELENKFVNEKK